MMKILLILMGWRLPEGQGYMTPRTYTISQISEGW